MTYLAVVKIDAEHVRQEQQDLIPGITTLGGSDVASSTANFLDLTCGSVG